MATNFLCMLIRSYLCVLFCSLDKLGNFPCSLRCLFPWRCLEVIEAVPAAWSHREDAYHLTAPWAPLCLGQAGPASLWFSRVLLLLNGKVSHMS